MIKGSYSYLLNVQIIPYFWSLYQKCDYLIITLFFQNLFASFKNNGVLYFFYYSIISKRTLGHCSSDSLNCETKQLSSLTSNVMRAHSSSCVLKSLLSHTVPAALIKKTITRNQMRSEVIAC